MVFDSLQHYLVWPGILAANFALGGGMVTYSAYMSERYPVAWYGLYTGVSMLASAVVCGGVTVATGAMYDIAAGPTPGAMCYGPKCFKWGFLTVMSCTAVSVVGFAVIYVRDIATGWQVPKKFDFKRKKKKKKKKSTLR
eukprot:TRINITY_DN2115_c0_g1_i3.p3 TRINITY_DN2115_c0_g1~~TRINITY_DN2115_c0_g1_i3.p3  ORF type:complete len:139 (-),score=56.86 TRINITY_DN2115_c0_g1_i3:12-428(-)